MKRNFMLLLLSLLVVSIVSAQRLLTEDFNYAKGELTVVSDSVWKHLSGTTEKIMVISPNLTYQGYVTNPVGTSRKIKLDSSTTNAESVSTTFATEDTGTIYCSFLLKVLSTHNLVARDSPTIEYFVSYLSSDNSNRIAPVAIKRGSAALTFKLGIFPRKGVGVVWANANYPVKDTLLLTIGYQFVSGDSNNVASLWINPPTDSLQPNPDAQVIDIDTGDSLKISKLGLYQRSKHSPVCQIDAIKISTTWDDAVLPLQLLSFNVLNNNGYANLRWQTCNEVNVKEFEVQKSSDAQNFLPVAHIPARNASCGTIYTYNDAKELAGTAYFRIRMVNNDGRSSYSGIVSVDGKLPTKISVFPNPFVNNLVLSHPKALDGATIRIVSLNGTVVASYSVQKDAVQTSIDMSKLAKGNYIVVYRNAQKQQTIEIIKQ